MISVRFRKHGIIKVPDNVEARRSLSINVLVMLLKRTIYQGRKTRNCNTQKQEAMRYPYDVEGMLLMQNLSISVGYKQNKRIQCLCLPTLYNMLSECWAWHILSLRLERVIGHIFDHWTIV